MPVKSKTAAKKKPFLFGLHHDNILKRAIFPYHLVTPQQVTQLLYSKGTIQTVKGYLTDMYREKLVQRIVLATQIGKRPYAYFLGLKARKILKDEGVTIDTSFELEELQSRSYGWIMHLLELNSFLIAAATLEKSIPAIQLTDWLHDFTLARNPPAAVKRDGTVAEVKPDGFLHFVHTLILAGQEKTRHYRFLVELDRGSESEEKFRKKIRDYWIISEHGELHKRFQAKPTNRFIVIFPTTAGEKRVELMRHYARTELKALKADIREDSYANIMFQFASIPPLMSEQPEQQALFCAPIWTPPYHESAQKTTLIELPR